MIFAFVNTNTIMKISKTFNRKNIDNARIISVMLVTIRAAARIWSAIPTAWGAALAWIWWWRKGCVWSMILNRTMKIRSHSTWFRITDNWINQILLLLHQIKICCIDACQPSFRWRSNRRSLSTDLLFWFSVATMRLEKPSSCSTNITFGHDECPLKLKYMSPPINGDLETEWMIWCWNYLN